MQLYGILGLTPNATEKDIKKSYYKLAKIYHPDKNKGNKTEEFQQINYAYNILINPRTREEYLKLNKNDENNFIQYLFKITKNSLTMEDLNQLNIKIKDLVNITINKWNLTDVMKNFNFEQIFNIFNNVKINDSYLLTETEEDDNNNVLYLFNLPPKFIDYNKNNIILNFDVTAQNILSDEYKKIKIIRNIFNSKIKENFTFEIKAPYIIFPNKGDDNNGHLIIQLNYPDNLVWFQDMLVINYFISIHQYLYGLDVNIDLFNENHSYNKWIPNRDGNLIILNTQENYDISIGIKFQIEYYHDELKEKILLDNF